MINLNIANRPFFLHFKTIIIAAVWILAGCVSTGSAPKQEENKKFSQSPQWNGDRFQNKLAPKEAGFFKILWSILFKGDENATPDKYPAIHSTTKQNLQLSSDQRLAITWMGHSTLLIQMEQQNILVDPVWSERCSPFSFIGPKRFHPPPIPLEQLPDIDVILISHDHYDHLDHETVKFFANKKAVFIVPLGVDSHLKYWGIPPERIFALDWWQSKNFQQIQFTVTPARHFSGRAINFSDRNKTLWAGFAIKSQNNNIFYSGDSAMFPEYEDIGERLGPFDLDLFEVGQYNQMWTDVHLGPEQALVAFEMVKAKLFIPVHWGTFELGLHAWTEPIERVHALAEKLGVCVLTPRPGESLYPFELQKTQKWWPNIKWSQAHDRTIISSGLPQNLVERILKVYDLAGQPLLPGPHQNPCDKLTINSSIGAR